MIEIYDNVFNFEELVGIENNILESDSSCTNTTDSFILRNSKGKIKNNHLFFGCHLFERNDLNEVTMWKSNTIYYFNILKKIENFLNRNYYVTSISTNIQPCGYDGSLHTDGPTNRHKTIMLMSNCYWEKEWGGQFQLINPDKNLTEEYEYIPGRILIFPGNHLHRGLGPKIGSTNHYRTTLVFRTEPLNF